MTTSWSYGRETAEARPVGMKHNKENTIIGAVWNESAKHALAASANRIQQGFIPGRQMIENVMNLDTYAQVFGAAGRGAPLAFFDFAAAFPSVMHSWIMIVIEQNSTPDGFRQIIRAMYGFVECGTVPEGAYFFMYLILSGVLQGCPLSGLIFAMAVDPFLNKFVAEAEDTGAAVIRACADDIGAALRDVSGLTILKPTFDDAKQYAGLSLKTKKCVLVPTAQRFSAEVELQIREWLAGNISAWSDFGVKPVSTYLGFLMGPAANSKQFSATIHKWRARSAAIAGRHSSAAVSAHQYNSRAIPVLGYKMQLAIPPNRLFRQEMGVLTHVLHMATGALDCSAFFNLQSVGGPLFRSTKALSVATLTRTAVKTLPSWKVDYDILEDNSELLSVGSLRHRILWEAHWDSPAIAALLRHASRGFPQGNVQSLGLEKSSWIIKDEHHIWAAVASPLAKVRRLPNRMGKFQNELTKELTRELYPLRITEVFEKRLSTVFVDHFGLCPRVDWSQTLKVLQGSSMHEAMVFVKTIANSWTTSARYHDAKLVCCAFGCSLERDDLAHYVACPRLWSEVDVASGANDEEEVDNVKQRLLTMDPTHD